MFNTVKETHIAVEMGLQHIVANRKQSIKPEFIDMALNLSILKYIDESFTPEKNTIGKGYEHNQVGYDELSPLRKDVSLPVLYKDNIYYCILPTNVYKNHVTSKTRLLFHRVLPNVNTTVVQKFIHTVLFNKAEPINNLYYADFKFSVNGRVVEPNLTISHADGRFMLINAVIEHFKEYEPSVEVYWQRYGDIYIANTFIVVTDNNYLAEQVNLTYDSVVINSLKTIQTLHKVNSEYNRESENQIVKSKTRNYITNNHYYNSNSHLQLNVSISGNNLIVPHGKNFRPVEVLMDYIKIPTLINYKTDTLSELKVNDKIVKLAVQYLKALIKDEGYNHMLQENKTI